MAVSWHPPLQSSLAKSPPLATQRIETHRPLTKMLYQASIRVHHVPLPRSLGSKVDSHGCDKPCPPTTPISSNLLHRTHFMLALSLPGSLSLPAGFNESSQFVFVVVPPASALLQFLLGPSSCSPTVFPRVPLDPCVVQDHILFNCAIQGAALHRTHMSTGLEKHVGVSTGRHVTGRRN